MITLSGTKADVVGISQASGFMVDFSLAGGAGVGWGKPYVGWAPAGQKKEIQNYRIQPGQWHHDGLVTWGGVGRSQVVGACCHPPGQPTCKSNWSGGCQLAPGRWQLTGLQHSARLQPIGRRIRHVPAMPTCRWFHQRG